MNFHSVVCSSGVVVVLIIILGIVQFFLKTHVAT